MAIVHNSVCCTPGAPKNKNNPKRTSRSPQEGPNKQHPKTATQGAPNRPPQHSASKAKQTKPTTAATRTAPKTTTRKTLLLPPEGHQKHRRIAATRRAPIVANQDKTNCCHPKGTNCGDPKYSHSANGACHHTETPAQAEHILTPKSQRERSTSSHRPPQRRSSASGAHHTTPHSGAPARAEGRAWPP